MKKIARVIKTVEIPIVLPDLGCASKNTPVVLVGKVGYNHNGWNVLMVVTAHSLWT
jgi:hypothetical protein